MSKGFKLSEILGDNGKDGKRQPKKKHGRIHCLSELLARQAQQKVSAVQPEPCLDKHLAGDCFVQPQHIGRNSGNRTSLKLTPDTIYQGHALEILKSFPAESVDCVVTSPPYFGLRCYGTEPVIWNGNKTCDHEWKQETLTGQKTAPTKYKKAKEAFKPTESAFCSKCGAFKGELGGEPAPELFISHLCDIFDEVKRVLKPTGTCFVNLADGYDKNRSLVGIPEMFVLEMKKRGWTYRNNIVWHHYCPASKRQGLTV